MKKILLIIIALFIITGCSNRIENTSNKIENTSNEIEDVSEVIDTMKVVINDNEYIVNLEDNETVKSFMKMLPLELNMNELNGNEKYYYLDSSLPTNSYVPDRINAGDIMLYGDNCLVLFYKSFDTSYSYTKIGHIDNLGDLGSGNVLVKFK
jgi:hypothetical protein